MRTIAAFILSLLLLVSCNRPAELSLPKKTDPDTAAERQYRSELDEIRKSVRGDVKIKLKKDGKGIYTWEISGKDAHEVLKVNDTLKKRLAD